MTCRSFNWDVMPAGFRKPAKAIAVAVCVHAASSSSSSSVAYGTACTIQRCCAVEEASEGETCSRQLRMAIGQLVVSYRPLAAYQFE